MLTLPWMSPSAPRTPPRLVLIALSPGSRPNFSTMDPTWPLFSAKTSHIPQLSGAPTGDLTPTRWPFCALSANPLRKRNIASAEVVFHRLHSSITLEIWRRSARQVRACWPVTALPADLDLDT